jgi:Mor family transcriptional regulator
MSRHNCANGRDVLPAEVLSLVQKHYDGLLYIPVPSCNRRRDEQICEMHSRGHSVEEIAKTTGLSRRRVWQILKKAHQ